MTLRSRSLVIGLIDLVAKHKSGELRCPATALITGSNDLRQTSQNSTKSGQSCKWSSSKLQYKDPPGHFGPNFRDVGTPALGVAVLWSV